MLNRPSPALLLLALATVTSLWFGCSDPSSTSSSGAGGGAQTGAGGQGGQTDAGPNELPCDVREVVEAVCANCHASPPTSNAPFALTSRYDFLAPWFTSGQSVGERSVIRMKSAQIPMPPRSEPPIAPHHLTTIEAWVDAGMPPGACGAIPPKPAATTCASQEYWMEAAAPSVLMSPGLACRECHKTDADTFNYFFMGTVFPSFHEEDLCNSPPPAGAKVELLDEQGNVTLTLTPNAAGNFMSSAVVPGVPLPYRARLVANGLARSMTTKQTDGDCNKCHTEQGAEGAPGRLVWPRPYE